MCAKLRLLLIILVSFVSLTAPVFGQLANDSQGVAVPFSWIRVVP